MNHPVASDDINEFPDEILAMIMEEFIHEPDLQRLAKARNILEFLSSYDEEDIDDRPQEYAAVLICLVCKRWREIALNTPRLWGQIHLGWPQATVSIYFERSGSSPLSLAINKRAVRSGQFRQITTSLATTNTLHRITRVSIQWYAEMSSLTWDYAPISPEILSWTRAILDNKISVPNLSQFHLQIRDDSIQVPTIENLAHLPLLTDVHFETISLKSTLPDPCRLTTVRAECSELKSLEIVDFLASCPLLEDVTLRHKKVDHVTLASDPRNDINILDILSDSDEEGNANTAKPRELPEEIIEYDDPPAPIDLRYLRKFSLGWCTTDFLENILRRVTFPEASHISLSIAREEGPTVLSSLPPTLREALPQSLALEIRSYRPDGTSLAFALTFKGLYSPRYSVTFNEFESTHDFHNNVEPSEQRTLRIHETEDLFQELSKIPFVFLLFFMLTARCLKDMEQDPINRLLLQFRRVQLIHIHTVNADRLIEALRSRGKKIFPCPALKTLDIRNSGFDPANLKKVLQDREDWAVELSELKVTLDPKLRAWKQNDQSASDVLEELDGCEAEEGSWTDSSASEDGDEDFDDSEDDENESDENWSPVEGVDYL
ncbi:hypothetical protein SISNIDRAFT_484506 [Sistotremastrum niveocremeum HHB9708]|uniref:Uncharacterized protein n=1 Tax=Sistotremastrum niveocremeum HHB9708 TaxID=1314777 RepID=A0A164WEV8_9AGAM|nr:hypothetical protein SISNIDRAFT_484506 [Sistotremastrum niveocremeum HHB9708]